ncbi:hypothetical protein QYS60_01920 [Rhodococcus sp. GXMU-t2271]|uniref:hypothetical protein n=1 Tax=Rhodococcus sp. GXMU-t2271 TaxID=3059079 RepID=UPI00352A3C4B
MDGLIHDQIRDLDALVVGAGFGGIYALPKLRNGEELDVVAIVDRRPRMVREFATVPAEVKQTLAAYRSRHEAELLPRASGTQFEGEI